MINKKELLDYLDELLPNASCELNYTKDYELVIAVMLSAQTTDKKVNKCTDFLFRKYDSLQSLDKAPIEDIEDIIRSIGLYKNKAKNLKGITRDLLTRFNGIVPSNKEELMSLPGVGNKTAGVVRAELFHIPEFPVDTHVLRISKRLGFVDDNATPEITEKALKRAFPKDRWIKLHHQFIHFGRYHCLARSPECKNCKLVAFCKEKHKNI